jgi:CBS domain-containing protein
MVDNWQQISLNYTDEAFPHEMEEDVITAGNVLQHKGSHVYAAEPGMTVFDALGRMAEHNVGVLMVIRDGTLVGVFSERDYARKVVLKGKFSRDTLVSEIMTPDPVSITPETDLWECMRLMTARQIRHLPVLDAHGLAGVVSIGDVVKYIIEDQADSIDHLTRYITGR